MLVSVLMSVYKEDTRFLCEAIESILNQTYRDFEFVIIGDSPKSDRERVFSVVEEYASKDGRIKFYPNAHNIGLPKSLNEGLSHCTGKYIVRMDADDISVPERLEKQVAFMEANPHILASGAWFEFIDEEGNHSGNIVRHKDSTEQIRLDILKNTVLGHPISIYRRVISGIDVRYDVSESVRYAEDYALWVWILQYGDISNIQEVLLYYRLSNQQITTRLINENMESAKEIQRKAFQLLYGLPLIESFLEVFSSITITGAKELTEDKAMKGFQDFLAQIKVTKKNYYVLKYLMDVYVNHFSHIIPKKHYHFLYDITKKNKVLMLWSEVDYFFCRIAEIICIRELYLPVLVILRNKVIAKIKKLLRRQYE
ncbi:MAG: glycosyltransferase [Prevotella sp.]|nr:glycosyltransferase [Prevotella sp.]